MGQTDQAKERRRQASSNRAIRIFVSSTFRDFGQERDILCALVFPELRRRARERFLEVIGIDLRWGITEEASQRGETLPICLREIDRSRPFFVGLLGDRYGWTPEPGQVSRELIADQPWLASHIGGASVTELEIQHGVLNNPAMHGRALFFFRDPKWSEQAGAQYLSANEEEKRKIARLRARIRESPAPVIDYSSPESFGELAIDQLWRLIDQEFPLTAVPSEIERMRRIHEAFAAERRHFYVRKGEALGELVKLLSHADDELRPVSKGRFVLVTADPGCGKSALLANAVEQLGRSCPGHFIFEHYCGAGAQSSDGVALLTRLTSELAQFVNGAVNGGITPPGGSAGIAELLQIASDWAVNSGSRITLVIDAIDRMNPIDRWRWFPGVLPPRVDLVVSGLPGEVSEEAIRLGAQVMPVTALSTSDVRAFIAESLGRRGRSLSSTEIARIAEHPMAGLPIFLKALMDELCAFGSHERLSERISTCLGASSPDQLFELILERIEHDIGTELVSKTLSAIWASAGGLAEQEILDFCRLSPVQWSIIRFSLDDALYESDGSISLAHRYIEVAVEGRFIRGHDELRDLHGRLLDYFNLQSDSARVSGLRKHHAEQIEILDAIHRALGEIERRKEEIRGVSFLRGSDCHLLSLHRRRDSLENMLRRRPNWHPGSCRIVGIGGSDSDYATHWKWDCCDRFAAGDASPPSRFEPSACCELPKAKRGFRTLRGVEGIIPYWDLEDIGSVIEVECLPRFGSTEARHPSDLRLRRLQAFLPVAPALHSIVQWIYWRELESELHAHGERLAEAGSFDAAAECGLEALEARFTKSVNHEYESGGARTDNRSDSSACSSLAIATKLVVSAVSSRSDSRRTGSLNFVQRFSRLANELREIRDPSPAIRTAVADFLATWASACEASGFKSEANLFSRASSLLREEGPGASAERPGS
jgi:nephrocystin-3